MKKYKLYFKFIYNSFVIRTKFRNEEPIFKYAMMATQMRASLYKSTKFFYVFNCNIKTAGNDLFPLSLEM